MQIGPVRKVIILSFALSISPLLAIPEGADVTLPRSSDRYVPGLISGEEAQVDRSVEITEKEQAEQTPVTAEKPVASAPKSLEDETGAGGFFAGLFRDRTILNMIFLGLILGLFFLYRLRTGGSRR